MSSINAKHVTMSVGKYHVSYDPSEDGSKILRGD